MRFFLTTIMAAIFLTSNLKAQTIQTEKKTIKYSNALEVFNVCLTNPSSITFKDDKEYFWYNSDFNRIKSTKGGCGGQLLHGKLKLYNEKGDLKADLNFNLGLRHGNGKQWDEEGNITETTHHTKGVCDYSKFKSENSDKCIEWNGEVLKKGSVKKVYTSYGRLITEEVQLGSLKYKLTEYYYSGKIKLQYTSRMLVDYFFGDYIEYYENGNKKFHGIWDDEGFKVGEWKWYNEDGSIDATEKYKKETKQYSNGKTKSKGSYIFDDYTNEWKKTGEWYFFKDDGEIDETLEYKFGVVQEKK